MTIYYQPMSPRMLIIINPAAARAGQTWPLIREHLTQANLQYDLYETTQVGDAIKAASRALHAGCELIAVVGGDGTFSEVANGYFSFGDGEAAIPQPINPNAALAILPAGTGNDFVRNLRPSRTPLKDWINALVTHAQQTQDCTTRMIDVIRVRTDSYRRRLICINASTLGLGGETAARVAAQGNAMRRLSGEARFLIAATGALVAWRERPARIHIDGSTLIEAPMNLAAVGNGRFAGGGMMLSPEAELDDGRLDVVAVSGLKRLNLLHELTRIHRGGHAANPKVTIKQGSQVSIDTFTAEDAMPIEVDGNVSGFTPADYSIVKAAIRIVG